MGWGMLDVMAAVADVEVEQMRGGQGLSRDLRASIDNGCGSVSVFTRVFSVLIKHYSLVSYQSILPSLSFLTDAANAVEPQPREPGHRAIEGGHQTHAPRSQPAKPQTSYFELRLHPGTDTAIAIRPRNSSAGDW